MIAVLAALRAALGERGERVAEIVPAVWDDLPPGTVILAREARLQRGVEGWRATDDGDAGPDAAALTLAGAASATLAHDLQGPLTAAIAAIELAADEAPPELVARLAAVVATLRRVGDAQALRARRFPRGLTTRGAVALDVLDETIPSLRAEFARRGVALDVTLPPADLAIDASLDLVAAALVHLTENALAASRPGARVRISFDVEASALRVDDDGVGLAAAHRDIVGTLGWTTRGGARGIGLWSLRGEAVIALAPRDGGGTRARCAFRR